MAAISMEELRDIVTESVDNQLADLPDDTTELALVKKDIISRREQMIEETLEATIKELQS